MNSGDCEADAVAANGNPMRSSEARAATVDYGSRLPLITQFATLVHCAQCIVADSAKTETRATVGLPIASECAMRNASAHK